MSMRTPLRAGDIVVVRGAKEIARTLDENGTVDGLPFMPEMLKFCGLRFQVAKVAHKTCDTVHYSGIRRMRATVHLKDLRCDGASHGGCEAGCLLFWKEVWLKVDGPRAAETSTTRNPARSPCTAEDLQALTRRTGSTDADVRYVCQVTELLRASTAWAWWNPSQYLADIRSGNATARQVFRTILLAALRWLLVKAPSYRVIVKVYNALARRWGVGEYFSRNDLKGIQLVPQPASTEPALGAGDLIRVRSRQEIVATLNPRGRHRGLGFDTEMVPYCGGTYRVRKVVTRLINEGTGEMMQMKNPCITLEGVTCRSEYSERRLLCPRSILSFWRPHWLERVAPGPDSTDGEAKLP